MSREPRAREACRGRPGARHPTERERRSRDARRRRHRERRRGGPQRPRVGAPGRSTAARALGRAAQGGVVGGDVLEHMHAGVPDGPDENVHRRLRGVRNALVLRGLASASRGDPLGVPERHRVCRDWPRGRQGRPGRVGRVRALAVTRRVRADPPGDVGQLVAQRCGEHTPHQAFASGHHALGARRPLPGAVHRARAPADKRSSGSGALDGLVLCGKSVSAPVRVHACGT